MTLPNDADYLIALFAEAAKAGGVVTIPPRDYYLTGERPVPHFFGHRGFRVRGEVSLAGGPG